MLLTTLEDETVEQKRIIAEDLTPLPQVLADHQAFLKASGFTVTGIY